MTQALAQNATDLAVSTPTEQDNVEMVRRLMVRAIKNPDRVATKERLNLNFSKLLNAVRGEWKSKNGGVARVPDEMDKVLQEIVQNEILSNINRINPQNSMSFNVKDALDFKNLAIVEKVTATGQNTLALKAQLAACNRLLRENSDKIEYYEKQMANGNSNKDYTELLKNAKRRKIELDMTKSHIQSTIEETEKAVK